jgi:hypothetical protein
MHGTMILPITPCFSVYTLPKARGTFFVFSPLTEECRYVTSLSSEQHDLDTVLRTLHQRVAPAAVGLMRSSQLSPPSDSLFLAL